MPAYYSIATAAIVTLRDISLFRGARPSKIFPAFASGIPVIYAGRGEGARQVEATQSGIVTPPEDADALSASIMELVRNPDFAHELGWNARKYVSENMAWPSIIDNWLRELAHHGYRRAGGTGSN
jgi:glycosyltransferase involved in cell wall biosynthesis